MRDGTGKLPTPDSHVDNEDGTKTMVYNRKRNEKKKKGGGEKREKREERLKKYNHSRKKGRTLNH